MAIKLGANEVDALYLGADLVDATYLGAGAAAEGGGEPDWWFDGALLDLDYENDRYYFNGSEGVLSDLTTGDLVTVAGGIKCTLEFDPEPPNDQLPTSRQILKAAVLSLMTTQLPDGFTHFCDWTDTSDLSIEPEFFGLYGRVDPANTSGNAGDQPIELFINMSGEDGNLKIDNWSDVFPSTETDFIPLGRNKAAITLNVPQGGGEYKNAVCLNAGTVFSENRNESFVGDIGGDGDQVPADGVVRCVSVGWIPSQDIWAGGTLHRWAILTPRSNAQIQTLTTA
jgi:hypothetical protein